MADALAAEAAGPVTAQPRHILAAVMGNALEFYDFITYSFFAIQIGHAFFPSKDSYVSLLASLGVFGAGFFTRPLGGWLLGWYADKVGRRASMMLSYVMMGSAITAMALIPPYAMIGVWAPVLVVLARLVQGFSLGGEVGSIMAFLTEAAAPNKRGFVVAWQGASQLIAATVGSSVGLLLSLVMSAHGLDAYGWRIAFLLGALTVPFGLMLRRTLPETLDAPEAPASGSSPVRIVVLAVMILAGGTISTYVLNYMTTFAQQSLHLGPTVAFLATMLPNAVAIPVALMAGTASDRIGRRPVMIWPQLIYVLAILPAFFLMVRHPSGLTVVGGACLISILSVVSTSSFYVAFSESLPKGVRSRAMATTYGLSIAIFGGSAQGLVTWLIHATGRPEAAGAYMFVSAVIALVAMCLILESAPVRRAQALAPA